MTETTTGPANAADVEEALRESDAAMYRVKETRRRPRD